MNKSIRVRLILALVLLALGAAQAVYAHYAPYFPADLWAAHLIQSVKSPALLAAMVALSAAFTGWYAAALVAASAFFIGWALGLLEALTVLLAGVLYFTSTLLKIVVARPRPAADLVEIIVPPTGFSYPSGHTFFAVMLIGVLAFFVLRRAPRRAGILLAAVLFTLTLAVAFSRVYLGGHWASDVVGSFFLAGSLLLFVTVAYDYLELRLRRKKQ